MSQYNTGTASTTAASNVIEGTGTLWLANVAVGDIIIMDGHNAFYQVSAINDDDEIEVSAPVSATLVDVDYVIVRDFTANIFLPLLNQSDLRAAEIYSRAMAAIDLALALTSGNPSIPANTMIYMNNPTNTTGFKFNSTTGQFEFYIDNVKVHAFPSY